MGASLRLTISLLSYSCSKRKRDEMDKRYVSIWFRHLTTDWFTLRQPHLKKCTICTSGTFSRQNGNHSNKRSRREEQEYTDGMVLADARAIVPDLEVLDDKPDLTDKLLNELPNGVFVLHLLSLLIHPDGLILDVTGCTHLWGGDSSYVSEIIKKLNARGYDVRASDGRYHWCCLGCCAFWKRTSCY